MKDLTPSILNGERLTFEPILLHSLLQTCLGPWILRFEIFGIWSLEFDTSEYIDARDGSIKFAFLVGITPLIFI
jgi:hypothetical protein